MAKQTRCTCQYIHGATRRKDGWLYCFMCDNRIGCGSDIDPDDDEERIVERYSQHERGHRV